MKFEKPTHPSHFETRHAMTVAMTLFSSWAEGKILIKAIDGHHSDRDLRR